MRQKIEEFLNEAERCCLEDINILEIDFNKKLNLKIIAIYSLFINLNYIIYSKNKIFQRYI